MPGDSAASPNKADNLRSVVAQLALKVAPDFIYWAGYGENFGIDEFKRLRSGMCASFMDCKKPLDTVCAKADCNLFAG
jgi:hypothetical protein